jgi:diguanylate cyclase (GGDEF)-like protein
MASEWSVTLTIDPGVLVALIAAFLAGYAAFSLRARGRTRRDPLSGLFQRQNFQTTIRETALLYSDRELFGAAGGAMLRARIDHMDQVNTIWGRAAYESAARMVGGVMRASVRETDQFRQIEGDGFVILVPDVDEHRATGIAERLRRSLALSRIEGMGADMRVTASFGVAARMGGETDAALRRRADEALAAARRAGEDHIVAASDIEEVLLLPAPAKVEAPSGAHDAPVDLTKRARAA